MDAMTSTQIDEGLLDQLADALMPRLAERLRRQPVPFLPDIQAMQTPASRPFMPYSTCSTRDFYHPEFARLSRMVGHEPFYHRKLWEYIYVLHHAFRMGAVGDGKRALVFGVGSERTLPALAKSGMTITATDAPADIGIAAGWLAGDQLAQGMAGIPELDMDRAAFERAVSFQPCDMNAINPTLREFDLCWSSCAFEHLGDLRKGMDFVINSVETLRLGGVAIHTTEFNLSSDTETIEEGGCVLYRRRDFDQLISELRTLGHEVDEFVVAPDSTVIDGFVDRPPYLHRPHLKLELDGFVTTSAGIVIRRGR